MAQTDILIIGAGAAGMMCAIEAGKRSKSVMLLDHAKNPGEKIRISGGGRCNFTNTKCKAENFISSNRHFVKSPLGRYSSADFIAMVARHNIAWHEKTLGQLFCNNRSTDIINMLLAEMQAVDVTLRVSTNVTSVEKIEGGFAVTTDTGNITCKSLVIATGGKSIPKMGATGFAYHLAEQFGINVVETRPALVPFTFDQDRLSTIRRLAGTAFQCRVTSAGKHFEEAALFTHRGLSGPAMLQISSYWREGENISVRFLDGAKPLAELPKARSRSGKQQVQNWLAGFFPANLAGFICNEAKVEGRLGDLTKAEAQRLTNALQDWQLKPAGTEGYRTAEVTLGGIDTNTLNSRTMEAKSVEGLYFIGEAVDVTGWLGGYNFQWAWSSGWVAGQAA